MACWECYKKAREISIPYEQYYKKWKDKYTALEGTLKGVIDMLQGDCNYCRNCTTKYILGYGCTCCENLEKWEMKWPE